MSESPKYYSPEEVIPGPGQQKYDLGDGSVFTITPSVDSPNIPYVSVRLDNTAEDADIHAELNIPAVWLKAAIEAAT